jgi:hypothetical protein
MCEYEFHSDHDSAKRSYSDDDDHDDDDEDYYDDADAYEISMPQNKDKKRKPIEAVEKAMTDKELKSYYNQYILILKEQRQQTKSLSDKQLHEILAQIFHSLQYKNDQSEGQLVYRCCQICYDKNEPMITMKVRLEKRFS